MSVLKKIASTRTPKNFFMQKAVGNTAFNLLDIGAGNHSPSKTVRLFPNCNYYGLDLNKDYAYDQRDFDALKDFYEMDLTDLKFESIPDNFFDYINMSHIIEHLHNGDMVIEKMTTKLKQGGHIYIEYPGERSTRLPSMQGTLNFYDDPTHVRIYSVKEVSDFLKKCGFTIISSGTRRNAYYIAAMPFRLIACLLKGKKPAANVFWDLLGFAEYVYASKN